MDMRLMTVCVIVILSLNTAASSIDGIYRPIVNATRHVDPCNPLYWYPRQIPEYCYDRKIPPSPVKPAPIPVPVPIPVPQPSVYPPSLPMPFSGVYPPMPTPFLMPIPLTNPHLPGLFYPSSPFQATFPGYSQQIGMVPGLPGIVSRDGGINILPFSDVYSDILEKHKQKMVRRRMEKFLDKYDKYPWRAWRF